MGLPERAMALAVPSTISMIFTLLPCRAVGHASCVCVCVCVCGGQCERGHAVHAESCPLNATWGNKAWDLPKCVQGAPRVFGGKCERRHAVHAESCPQNKVKSENMGPVHLNACRVRLAGVVASVSGDTLWEDPAGRAGSGTPLPGEHSPLFLKYYILLYVLLYITLHSYMVQAQFLSKDS